MSYKDLKLNLPKQLLPSKLNFTNIDNIYKQLTHKNENQNLIGIEYIILDGPPYANGNLHIGHLINRTIKDLLIRNAIVFLRKKVKYIIGWDCHGLPIEAKAIQNLHEQIRHNTIYTRETINNESKKIMEFYIQKHKQQLQEFHMFTYDVTYKTHSESYILDTLTTLWNLVKWNYITYVKQPNFYSFEEQTNLAFAEIEYREKTSTSLFFKVKIMESNMYLIIWTTQPWTILGNKFVAINSSIYYVQVDIEGSICIVSYTYATKYKLNIIKDVNIEWLLQQQYKMLYATCCGKIIQDDKHVKDDGTGILHIAPAHGHEDFEIGVKHNLDPQNIHNCVDKQGNAYINTLSQYTITDGSLNNAIIHELKQQNLLVHQCTIKHMYPFSCRSKKPVYIITSNQVVITISEEDKHEIITQFANTIWCAKEGYNTFKNTISQRPKMWCITRQRSWGVPCMLFIDKNHNIIYEPKLNAYLLELVKKYGIEFWYNNEFVYGVLQKYNLAHFYLTHITCVLDVWFESGIAAIHLCNQIQTYKHIDAIVEGKDQHRGWFSSIGVLNTINKIDIQFKHIVVHGFACYVKNKKISKSHIESIQKTTNIMQDTYSEIMRLYIICSDFYQDIVINEDNIQNAKKMYLTLYGIIRFFVNILANTTLKNTEQNIEINSLNYYLYRQYTLQYDIMKNNLSAGQLNTMYYNMNIIIKIVREIIRINKDTVYCDDINAIYVQNILYLFQHILYTLTRFVYLICPGLAMYCMSLHIKLTSEYNFIKQICKPTLQFYSNATQQEHKFWASMYEIYDLVNIKLDVHKKNKHINSNYEIDLVFFDKDYNFELIKKNIQHIAQLFDVSNALYMTKTNKTMQTNLIIDQIQYNNLIIYIRNITHVYYKCYRCWKYVNTSPDNTCARCYVVLNK